MVFGKPKRAEEMGDGTPAASQGVFHAVTLTLVVFAFVSCGRKQPAIPAAGSASAPIKIEAIAGGATEVPPPPPVSAIAAVAPAPVEAAKQETGPEDPVTQLQRRELEEMNRGLKAFLVKHQRMPKDFTEFAQNVDGVPGPPLGKYWVIDPETKTIKLKSRE
jgi:hypothetical protein